MIEGVLYLHTFAACEIPLKGKFHAENDEVAPRRRFSLSKGSQPICGYTWCRHKSMPLSIMTGSEFDFADGNQRNPSDPSFELWGAAIFTVTDVANMHGAGANGKLHASPQFHAYADADAVGQTVLNIYLDSSELLAKQPAAAYIRCERFEHTMTNLLRRKSFQLQYCLRNGTGVLSQCYLYPTLQSATHCAAVMKLTFKPLRECVGSRSSIAFENSNLIHRAKISRKADS